MCRQNWGNIEGKLIKTFTENFLDKGFSKYVKKFSRSQTLYELTWENGSQIVFMAESFDSDKELNRFKGLEINGAFIDEVNEIQETTFDKIIERSGSWFHSPNCPAKILMSCNPANNWVKQRFYDKWKEGALPNEVAYIPSKITDNPYVPQEYLDNLKMLPTYQYMVFVEGDWDVQLKVGGEFYKSFEMEKHIGSCPYDPALPLHISWDDNVVPYLPCGIFQLQGKELRMVAEITGINPYNTIKAVCNEIKRLYPNHNTGMFVYGDATAEKQDTKIEKGMSFYRIVAQELAQYHPKMRVTPSNPSVIQRGNFINSCLEHNYKGIRFTVDTSCKETIKDFVLLKEASDGTKLKEMATDPVTKARFQKVGHFTDLTDYIFCSAFSVEFDAYQRGPGDSTMMASRSPLKRNSY